MRRRRFLHGSLLSGFSWVAGAHVPFAANMPKGYLPLWDQKDPYELFGKDREMTLLNDRPWNMEAQAHLLDDAVTPADKMFIRNNGTIPEDVSAEKWIMTVDGESVLSSKNYSLQDLKSRFKKYSYQLTLECGGNGRSEFSPPASGNQWTVGAVSCAVWSGLRLRDLLDDAGVRDDAVYVAYYGADTHLTGDPDRDPISRGVPISKAMMDETILAYEMNGKEIPLAHGFPLRLVAGGWPASASGKWIDRLSVRNIVHDGAKMKGQSYRIPCDPVPPGTEVSDEDMCIIESMPVKSLITFPKSGAIISEDEKIDIRGHAWAGELDVSRVEYSIDFGGTWRPFEVTSPVNRLAWQHFSGRISFPGKGYYEVWAKAFDSRGTAQPMVIPGWNPKGYLNNACHRIAIKVL